MHTADPDAGGHQMPISERHDKVPGKFDRFNPAGGSRWIDSDNFTTETDYQSYSGNPTKNLDKAGTIWDIFRRQDVPKLNEFFRVYSDKFANSVSSPVFFLFIQTCSSFCMLICILFI